MGTGHLGGGSGGGHDGGRTPPDSSDLSSSDSLDSTDSDSSEMNSEADTPDEGPAPTPRGKSPSKKRHRKKQHDEARLMQRVLKRINLKPPAKWDGTLDLDGFDTWKYNLNTWVELNQVPDYIMVKTMTYYITGKASQFFMNHVARSKFTWTLDNVYDGLFDYCFPEDFKTMLRDRLEFATQGRAHVRDYVRDIEQLAARFSNVSEFQLVQIFWHGLNPYLKVGLIEKGHGPETTQLDKLVRKAV